MMKMESGLGHDPPCWLSLSRPTMMWTKLDGQVSLGGPTKKWASSDLSSLLCGSSPSHKIFEGPPPSPLVIFILFRYLLRAHHIPPLPPCGSHTLCSSRANIPFPDPWSQPLLLSPGGSACRSLGSHRLDSGKDTI